MNVKMIGAAVLAGVMVAGCGKSENEQPKAEGKAAPQAAEKAAKAAEAVAKAAKPADPNALAISVNGVKLTRGALDADVDSVIKFQSAKMPGGKIPDEQLEMARQSISAQLVQKFIFENLLLAKVKENGIVLTDADRKEHEAKLLKMFAKSPRAPKSIDEMFKENPFGEKRARQDFDNNVLIDKLIRAEMAKTAPKKDYAAEAKKIIDNVVSNNAVAKTSGTTVLKKINELKAQLDKVPAANLTNEFAKLAKANSDCPSGNPEKFGRTEEDKKKTPGSLGTFGHGQMVKEFDEAAFKLPVNKVSDPVKTQYGYHLILVTKKVPAAEAKDEKVEASHILLKIAQEQPVPSAEELVQQLEAQDMRVFMGPYIQGLFKAGKFEAAEEFKQFLPKEEPAASPAKAPVEKPAK